jgi:hypothetical protein
MPTIHWTNGWVGPSRGSGHWEQNISASASSIVQSIQYRGKFSHNSRTCPNTTKYWQCSAQARPASKLHFQKRLDERYYISVQEAHVSLRFLRTRRSILYWSTAAAPHLAHFIILLPPLPPLQTENNSHRTASNGQLTITATMNGACHATLVR